MLALHDAGHSCDSVTVNHALAESEKIGDVGAAYLAQLMDHPVSTSIEGHCQILLVSYEKRQFCILGNDIIDRARATVNGGPPLCDWVEEALDKVVAERPDALPRRRQFGLNHIAAVEIKMPDFLIHQVLERDSIFSLFGPPAAQRHLLHLLWRVAWQAAEIFTGNR